MMRFWENNQRIEQYRSTGIITPEEMQIIDGNARALGISSLQLMEGAGHGLADFIRTYAPSTVLILCGSRNNGGDGFVVARHLAGEMDVHVCYYQGDNPSPSFITQLKTLKSCAVRLHRIRCPGDVTIRSNLFHQADLIVDALLGTGVKGELREPYVTLVETANNSGKVIISADIPTPGIRPDRVCAFHRAKTEGAHIVDIGIPILAEICTGPGDLLLVPGRKSSAHKGAGGHVLVIGGGPYQGAPYLAGMAALRAGADIVRIASPNSLHFPDLIHEPLQGDHISDKHIELLADRCQDADVVICGMGLGDRSHQVIEAISPFCRKAVFDADALRLPLPGTSETIYTPHAGEFKRITGKTLSEETLIRAEEIKAAKVPGTVLLKGAVDIISEGGRTRFNRTGTAAMTTGGTGDVLAGVCGALLVHLQAFDAACIGAYVTGRAGEEAERTTGYGMTAQDLLYYIPQILYSKDQELYD